MRRNAAALCSLVRSKDTEGTASGVTHTSRKLLARAE